MGGGEMLQSVTFQTVSRFGRDPLMLCLAFKVGKLDNAEMLDPEMGNGAALNDHSAALLLPTRSASPATVRPCTMIEKITTI